MCASRYGLLMQPPSLNDEQLERYARHIILKEIGGAGQVRLAQARVAVVGAGGIGAPALLYLAAAGVGHIRVLDDDAVALSNLQRQILYGTADVGQPKVAAAQAALHALNPYVTVEALPTRIAAENAQALLQGVDVILDGCDNFGTRLAVSDASCALHIPLVSAAVGGFAGQLGVFEGWQTGSPCYRCFVGDAPERPDISCADQGIIGALTGIMGSMAALEVIRVLVPFGESVLGKLLLLDMLSRQFRSLRLHKDAACTCATLNARHL
jgi:molybdopterin-synthase adenylyltransferase